MLRITVYTDESGSTLQMEGRLAGPAIIEAERSWQATRGQCPEQPLRVDLRAVTFMDKEGISFLKQVFQQGAGFLSTGCLTRAYVEEITRSGRE